MDVLVWLFFLDKEVLFFSFPLQGYKYIVPEGECCGRCQKTACEEMHFWPRGDEDPPLHEVRCQWDLWHFPSSQKPLELFCVPWKEMKMLPAFSSTHQASLRDNVFGILWPTQSIPTCESSPPFFRPDILCTIANFSHGSLKECSLGIMPPWLSANCLNYPS